MKGLVFDLLTIIILFIGVAITVFFMFLVLGNIKTNVAASGVINSTYFQQGQDALLIFDYGLLMLLFGGLAVSLLLAFTLRTHTAFIIISIILLIIIIPVTAILTNVFRDIAASSDLAATAANFPIIITVVNNFPVIMAIGGILIIIVLYARIKSSNETSGA